MFLEMTINFEDLNSKSFANLDKNSKVILRASLNVPLNNFGEIEDDTRIIESLECIKKILSFCKNLVILTHIGRPDPKNIDKKLSTKILGDHLNKLIPDFTCEFIPDLSEASIEFINSNNIQKTKKYFLIENIRFFEDEENADAVARENFGFRLSKLGNIYVNNAFADYRSSASTVEITKFSRALIGPLFLKEIDNLEKLKTPKNPYIFIIGGAKLSEKIKLIEKVAPLADKIIIGGAMAYTLQKSIGFKTGKSLIEQDLINKSLEIITKYKEKIILPLDHIITDRFENNSSITNSNNEEISDDFFGIDIGEKTIHKYKLEIDRAKTIVWNGPMGVYEWKNGSKGTLEIGKAISSNKNALSIVGGGDTINMLNKFGLNDFTHISTGGGAMIAYISGDRNIPLDSILNQKI